MPVQVLIIDDDPVSLENSRQKIALFTAEENICTAMDSVEVMRILKSKPVDLVFIDLEMPDTDGFAIADFIQQAQPKAKYVFLTGHTEMGAKSYDYEPLDFLCKPVDTLRLKKTFDRFENLRTSSGFSKKQVAIESNNGFVLVSPADIRYIARESRKVIIHCKGKDYVVKSSLDEMETVFSDFDLYRVHQSYLVPIQNISSVMQADFGNTYSATLKDGTQIPVSRWKYAALREHLFSGGVQFV